MFFSVPCVVKWFRSWVWTGVCCHGAAQTEHTAVWCLMKLPLTYTVYSKSCINQLGLYVILYINILERCHFWGKKLTKLNLRIMQDCDTVRARLNYDVIRGIYDRPLIPYLIKM